MIELVSARSVPRAAALRGCPCGALARLAAPLVALALAVVHAQVSSAVIGPPLAAPSAAAPSADPPAAPPPADAAVDEPRALVWRSHGAWPGTRDAEAVALCADGRVAVGDARGVWLASAGAAPRRALGRGPVRELRFDPLGRLLAATDRGLYAIETDGRVRKLALAGGGKASRARRVAVAGSALAAGTEDGVQLALEGHSFARLDGGVPDGPVDALGLRPVDGGLELWLVTAGALHRVELAPAAGAGTAAPAAGVLRAEAIAIAEGPGAREALDVAVDLAGANVAVLSATDLAVLRGDAWRSLPLGLPAGARARRLGRGVGRLFVATDAGLVEATGFEGPWRRAAPPAGATAATALAGDESRVLATTARGLLEAREEVAGTAPRSTAPLAHALDHDDWLARVRGEPAVQTVHAAALRYLALGPERMRSLQRGVDRRGWLPVLELRGSAGRVRSTRLDRDQVLTSGLLNELFDRQLDRGTDYGGALVLAWELGDLAYHPESIDVSHEAREVIELRDEVLDEVTQLYYERRRT
ncbi:MAG TPA: hypothetical protein VHQ66_13480, partial [Myxococcota bacterium]|nr:hypothetical protein [Myxococcota bacterium]